MRSPLERLFPVNMGQGLPVTSFRFHPKCYLSPMNANQSPTLVDAMRAASSAKSIDEIAAELGVHVRDVYSYAMFAGVKAAFYCDDKAYFSGGDVALIRAAHEKHGPLRWRRVEGSDSDDSDLKTDLYDSLLADAAARLPRCE